MLDPPRSLGGLRVTELVLFIVGITLSVLCSNVSPWTQHSPPDSFARPSVRRELDCRIALLYLVAKLGGCRNTWSDGTDAERLCLLQWIYPSKYVPYRQLIPVCLDVLNWLLLLAAYSLFTAMY